LGGRAAWVAGCARRGARRAALAPTVLRALRARGRAGCPRRGARGAALAPTVLRALRGRGRAGGPRRGARGAALARAVQRALRARGRAGGRPADWGRQWCGSTTRLDGGGGGWGIRLWRQDVGGGQSAMAAAPCACKRPPRGPPALRRPARAPEGLTRRELGQPPLLHVPEALADHVHHLGLVGQQVRRGVVLADALGEALEARQVLEGQVDLSGVGLGGWARRAPGKAVHVWAMCARGLPCGCPRPCSARPRARQAPRRAPSWWCRPCAGCRGGR
jgi:hypothetical protein